MLCKKWEAKRETLAPRAACYWDSLTGVEVFAEGRRHPPATLWLFVTSPSDVIGPWLISGGDVTAPSFVHVPAQGPRRTCDLTTHRSLCCYQSNHIWDLNYIQFRRFKLEGYANIQVLYSKLLSLCNDDRVGYFYQLGLWTRGGSVNI